MARFRRFLLILTFLYVVVGVLVGLRKEYREDGEDGGWGGGGDDDDRPGRPGPSGGGLQFRWAEFEREVFVAWQQHTQNCR